MKFHAGDIVQFITNNGDRSTYLVVCETDVPGIATQGEAYFYDALELIGDDAGDTIGIVIDDYNRKSWRILA